LPICAASSSVNFVIVRTLHHTRFPPATATPEISESTYFDAHQNSEQAELALLRNAVAMEKRRCGL
jgi:hypothetical protein